MLLSNDQFRTALNHDGAGSRETHGSQILAGLQRLPDSRDLVQAIERHPEVNEPSEFIGDPLYYRKSIRSTEALFAALMNASGSLRSLFGIVSSQGETFTFLRAFHAFTGNFELSLRHGWRTRMATISVSTLPNLLMVVIDDWNERCRPLGNIPHSFDFAHVAARVDQSAGNTHYRLVGVVRGSWYSSRHSYESAQVTTDTDSLGLTAVLFERA
jgi:hypothetical protein